MRDASTRPRLVLDDPRELLGQMQAVLEDERRQATSSPALRDLCAALAMLQIREQLGDARLRTRQMVAHSERTIMHSQRVIAAVHQTIATSRNEATPAGATSSACEPHPPEGDSSSSHGR
jgi:hypothetical protein